MLEDEKKEFAIVIRDSIHNFVVDESNELDNEIFRGRFQSFIQKLEGCESKAYLDGIADPKDKNRFIYAEDFYALSEKEQNKLRATHVDKNGKKKPFITTVGIGANIEDKKVQANYDALLGEEGLLEKVYYGKIQLSDQQISKMFKYDTQTRLEELKKIYGEDWDKLRVNEKYTVLSLYFNFPGLANGKTNLRKHIKKYVETNNKIHLENAVYEVTKKSNRKQQDGIQNRRNAEGAMLASYQCRTYTKPNEAADSKKITIAELDKTSIPINSDSSELNKNEKYFIWRTKMDGKVRAEHVKFEGKIYRKDKPPTSYMPGTSHNCRCTAEPVPDPIIVNDEEEKKQAFNLYLRKGVFNRILTI